MVDTRTFDRLSGEEYKRRSQAHWGDVPCGSNTSDKEPLSREYFDEIEAYRYRLHPWILENIERFPIDDKQVLEIGYGMGTDHLALARQGARMHGIDLTKRNFELTSRRFELYGEHSALITGDGEALAYADGSFDFVYSFGVIHHMPDAEKVISEIHRVLKPGGRCWVTVYHKNSLYFWWTVYLWKHILKRGYRKHTLQQALSLLEYPGDDPDLIVRLYRRAELVRLFDRFGSCRSEIRHLLAGNVVGLHRILSDPERPRPLLDWLGKRWGWYVVVDAVK